MRKLRGVTCRGINLSILKRLQLYRNTAIHSCNRFKLPSAFSCNRPYSRVHQSLKMDEVKWNPLDWSPISEVEPKDAFYRPPASPHHDTAHDSIVLYKLPRPDSQHRIQSQGWCTKSCSQLLWSSDLVTSSSVTLYQLSPWQLHT